MTSAQAWVKIQRFQWSNLSHPHAGVVKAVIRHGHTDGVFPLLALEQYTITLNDSQKSKHATHHLDWLPPPPHEA